MNRYLRILLLATLLTGLWLPVETSPLRAGASPRIPEEELLDIGILVFDPGIERKSYLLMGYEYINPELRQSEAAFLAVHLMRSLQQTESFGLVRMMPRNSVSADLFVYGRIRESSGRRLGLELEVVDATGRRWFKRRYKQKAMYASHVLSFHSNIEPFQQVYDEFAEDLIEVQRRMKDKYLEDVRHIAELRFAEQLAPGVFGDYLTVDRKGHVGLDRLPAHDDPMLARVRRIRTRDEFFLDLLAERYRRFYSTMDRPYDDFRATRYEIEVALRDARAQANLANARALFAPPSDGFRMRDPVLERADFFRRQVAAQSQYLDEIASDFAAELDPLRLELDGEVIRFEGTIEDQYRQWQELLERIFETETGFAADRPYPAADLNVRH